MHTRIPFEENLQMIIDLFSFIPGKNEQACYDKLKDLELPNEPDGEIEKDQFTFEKFWELYLKLCPRNDILKLFKSM